MGQAAVDLPDPLDQQPPTANPGGMDDLLSQLAGDEIDRLLAEADEEVPPLKAATPIDAPVDPIQFDDEPPPPQVAPQVATAPKLSPNPPLAKLNQLADLPPEPGVAPAKAPAASASLADDAMTVDAETQASLDALSSELEAQPAGLQSGVLPPGAVEKVLADEAAGLIGTPRVAGLAPKPDSAEELGTSADERGALSNGVDVELDQAARSKAPLGAAAVVPAGAAAEISSKDLDAVLGAAEEDALPLLLRPLEWLNAPLAACSPGVRDTIGKAAIITMINAVAVLAYVAFFRH